jgi:hypothetical protein
MGGNKYSETSVEQGHNVLNKLTVKRRVNFGKKKPADHDGPVV